MQSLGSAAHLCALPKINFLYEDASNMFPGSILDWPIIHVPDQFISSHDGFKVLKLLYKKEGDGQDSRSFSIVLFLPNERNDLHDFIKVVASYILFVFFSLQIWSRFN